MTLDLIERQILKEGLHRELQTKLTYSASESSDLSSCSWVFRENITSDMYIYYEEVAKRDMPGFEIYPHHRKMNIEAPQSISKPEEFIWRLPLK